MKLLSEFCFSSYIDVVVVLAYNILFGNVAVIVVVAIILLLLLSKLLLIFYIVML